MIHFAAAKSVEESQRRPLHYHSNNQGSLIALVEVMLEHGVRDLVFSSSCTVYGQPDALPVTEETPFAPAASVYGATKQNCEQILRDVIAAEAPLRVMLLRYFNPIAPIERSDRGAPARRARHLSPRDHAERGGDPRRDPGLRRRLSTPDGSCIRDYIHVLDLADAHVQSLNWMARQGDDPLVEWLNVGTGRGISVFEAIEAFERATKQKVEHRVGPRRSGDIEQIYASCAKIESLLGWRATRTIDEAMADAWRWQQVITSRLSGGRRARRAAADGETTARGSAPHRRGIRLTALLWTTLSLSLGWVVFAYAGYPCSCCGARGGRSPRAATRPPSRRPRSA